MLLSHRCDKENLLSLKVTYKRCSCSAGSLSLLCMLLHVVRNVTEQGLSKLVVLPQSDSYDSAVCCLAADVDFDGQCEVLIGTYGQVR